MSPTIWLSEAYISDRLAFPFPGGRPEEPDPEYTQEFQNYPRSAPNYRLMSGERVDIDLLPKKIYGLKSHKSHKITQDGKKLPHAFFSRYVYVSAEIAAVIREFDVYEHALHPVELYMPDMTTRVERPYYLLQFGEQKNTVDIDRSEEITRAFGSPTGDLKLPINLNSPGRTHPPKLVYLPEALEGPDMWVDPRFARAIFFSDRLGAALIKAKFKTALCLYPLVGPDS